MEWSNDGMGNRRKKNEPLSYLTPDQVSRLENACTSPVEALLVRTTYATGARISEVLSLRPCDVDSIHQRVSLPALKRKDAERKLAIVDSETLRRIAELAARTKAERRLFPYTRQKAYYIIRMAARRAELGEVHPHMLRDSLAVNWALSGGNLNLLQRQLGHRSFATTVNRYLTFSSEDVRGEYNRVFRRD